MRRYSYTIIDDIEEKIEECKQVIRKEYPGIKPKTTDIITSALVNYWYKLTQQKDS